MTGWKTWVAAAAMGLVGLGKCFAAFVPLFDGGSIDGALLNEGWLMVAGALGMIGLGHKVEKNGIPMYRAQKKKQ